jgi:NADPH:quinone reductase-like Zn-dependent oxidoreductase
MRAAVIHRTGGPEVLQLEEVPRPEPADGEVLIRVHAASVNPIDWKRRRGERTLEVPAVLGRDVSGTVEVSRAAGYAEGDAVFGTAGTGGYAEYTASSADQIARKPDAITHEQAAAIPVAGLTAWQGVVDHGGLTAGETALVAGAAGGVGHFAVQFARHAGARTIGTGSTANRDFVLGLGVDQYVDYTREGETNAVTGVDLAYDTVGGETTTALLDAVRDGGVLVGIAGPLPEEAARARGISSHRVRMNPSPEELAHIAGLVAQGDVHVEIADVLPLAEVARAHAISESGHVRGKLVLRVAA